MILKIKKNIIMHFFLLFKVLKQSINEFDKNFMCLFLLLFLLFIFIKH